MALNQNKAIRLESEPTNINEQITGSTNQNTEELILGFFNNTVDSLAQIIQSVFSFFALIFIVYLIIKAILGAKSSGAKGALEQIDQDFKTLLRFFGSIFKGLKKTILAAFGFFYRHKILTALLIALIIIWKIELVGVMKVYPGQKAVDVESGRILKPGIHIVSPLFSDYIIAHVADYQFSIPAITADSKYPELQDVVINANVTFHLDQKKLVDFYSRYGAQMSIWKTSNEIVSPRVIEEIKNIVKNYSFKQVHEQQAEIKTESMEKIAKVLEPKGIILDDLTLVNIKISQKFVDVFGDKEILEERKQLESAELEQEQIKTQKELEIANREKQKKVIEAEGIKQANALVSSQQINENMLELQRIENEKLKIEKWDGETPENVGGEFSL
ncbi:MAG: hypothetical protein GF332_02630 [Candidatus Moranbacteria bacterium]|nr:hypothetical protein [Candidatus Moranbacteria bacterium]